MTRISKQSQAELTLKRLERLPAEEGLRQIEIILRAERPFTIMRKVLQPFHFKAKARMMRLGMSRIERKKK